MIVIDFGTAITFDCISSDCDYKGGTILPGIAISLEALSTKAAKLPHIDISNPPASIIGKNTVDAMKSGVLFGYGSMIDGMVELLTTELQKVYSISMDVCMDKCEPLCPPPVSCGARLGVFAPAGRILDIPAFEAGLDILKNLGYQIVCPKEYWLGHNYLADKDRNRINEFLAMWQDPQIDAMIAARGGFGCLRLLPTLLAANLSKTPKR
ncbi:unnamed protein product, partial [Cyprideis torosa]